MIFVVLEIHSRITKGTPRALQQHLKPATAPLPKNAEEHLNTTERALLNSPGSVQKMLNHVHGGATPANVRAILSCYPSAISVAGIKRSSKPLRMIVIILIAIAITLERSTTKKARETYHRGLQALLRSPALH